MSVPFLSGTTSELELEVAYREDAGVRKWIWRSAGLSLLSLMDIQGVWFEAMNQCPDVRPRL